MELASSAETPAIRRAGDRDRPGILRCLAAAFAPYREAYTVDVFADTVLSRRSIGRRLRSHAVFVAIDRRGRVVGTVGGRARGRGEGHVRGMAVVPAWQGRGVAPRLLGRVEDELRARGCTFVTLDTTEPLRRAARFYRRRGYRRTGRARRFSGMALLEFRKELPRPAGARPSPRAGRRRLKARRRGRSRRP